MNYTLSEVKPRIFFLKFKDPYTLAMTFLRYQEYYESPSPKFRGKQFQILDFMAWYSAKYGEGVFTYPKDWAGFNLPGHIISDVWNTGILDRNQYDYEMKLIHNRCQQIYPNESFYIIGASSDDEVMRHEIAHGLFYTEPSYRKKAKDLVKKLPSSIKTDMNAALKKLGYTPAVYVDETQAYFSTGVPDYFEVDFNKEDKPFIELFSSYFNR